MSDDSVVRFGKNLKRLMAERDLSYRELGRQIGIHHVTLYRYANAIVDPPLQATIKISRYFGRTLDEMAGEE